MAGNLHNGVLTARVPHPGKELLQLQAFRGGPFRGEGLLANEIAHGANESHLCPPGLLQNGFQQQGDGGLSVGAGDADALHGLCRVPVKIAGHLGQRQTVRGNQDIGDLYIRLFRRDRHNGSPFHRHGDESVPVRGKAGDGRKQAPWHCLSGIVDDGSNFRFQIGVDFCYGHAL